MTLAVSLAIAGSATFGAGAAGAAPGGQVSSGSDPDVVSVELVPGVQYTGNVHDNTTAISTPFGTLTTIGGQLQVAGVDGGTVFGEPSMAVAPQSRTVIPAPATSSSLSDGPVEGDTIPGDSPILGRVAASATPEATDPLADFEAALAVAGGNFGLAAGVGSMAGGLVGMAIGCPLGIVTGGALTSVTVIGTPLGMIGGCLLGAGAVGGVGAMIGGAMVGIPVGIASAAQMYNTLHDQGHI
ncbi:hypothetical protein ACQPZ2_29080 [Nocardia pseudovaccinii]|uniref:hypothetical protein n=1 Tax=Nocardia pseudovaccinii TaxID=189540 RepID=UPI003D89E57A